MFLLKLSIDKNSSANVRIYCMVFLRIIDTARVDYSNPASSYEFPLACNYVPSLETNQEQLNRNSRCKSHIMHVYDTVQTSCTFTSIVALGSITHFERGDALPACCFLITPRANCISTRSTRRVTKSATTRA